MVDREALLTHDVAVIRQAMKEIGEGNGVEVETAFRSIRAELMAMKAASNVATHCSNQILDH